MDCSRNSARAAPSTDIAHVRRDDEYTQVADALACRSRGAATPRAHTSECVQARACREMRCHDRRVLVWLVQLRLRNVSAPQVETCARAADAPSHTGRAA